jgi:hypothetical protein
MDETIAQAAVAEALEAYRMALLVANKATLEALCMDQLSYGHSSGLVQTKAQFLADATSGRTLWNWISFEAQASRIVGDNAISRFLFLGENEAMGKVNSLKFNVVVVWHKFGGQWRMLLRQGYKV